MTAFDDLLPMISRLMELSGEFVVVKVGGSVLPHREALLMDLVLLYKAGAYPVVVHGGGKEVTAWEERLGRQPRWIQGLRVTDAETLELVQMVLVGKVNKDLVAALNARGATAIGLAGMDGNLIHARQRTDPSGLGFVGEIAGIETTLLMALCQGDLLPVVAPLGIGPEGEVFNINADTVAGEVASALTAAHLLFLTDVPGVLDKDGKVIESLTAARARRLIRQGVISGGMIPKVEACLSPLAAVGAVHIVDGREPHALLRQLLGDHAVGTRFQGATD